MKLSSLNGELAWAIIAQNIVENKEFRSIRGIVYQATFHADIISYQGGNRNNGGEESISKKDFIQAFNSVKTLSNINTSSIKSIIPTSLYRKRTPFIGLLHSAKVLV